ncbi:hypothetical protein BJ165DRAFT_1315231, partial [Panaeolus papilionaceus]
LRDYELQDSEWDVLKELCAILKILKHATLFFSRSTPSLAYVILVMDRMNDQFTETANNKNLSPAIRTAVGLAKRTLNRYYSRTDDSETYRIAMMLHPQYKTDYFQRAKWEPEWISTA